MAIDDAGGRAPRTSPADRKTAFARSFRPCAAQRFWEPNLELLVCPDTLQPINSRLFPLSDKLRMVATCAYVCVVIIATLGWLALLWWCVSEFF